MRQLLKNFNKFDLFLKHQLLIGLFVQCIWALVCPLIAKLQGILWTTTYISIYMIAIEASGLFVPYFKGISIKNSYLSLIGLNILYILGTIIYFYNQQLFLLTESLLSVLFCINIAVLEIGWDVHIITKYSKDTFENYEYCSTFRDAVGGILGYSIVILIYQFLDEYQSMKLFVFLMFFVLLLQLLNYRKHYSKIK